MAENLSRRDLFGGLFAAGFAWMGLRATAAPATPPAVAGPPPTGESSFQTDYVYDSLHRVTTWVYDACGGRLADKQAGGLIDPRIVPPTMPATNEANDGPQDPPSEKPPEKA